MKYNFSRSDALTIFSIMYAYSKAIEDNELNSLCDMALQKERSLSKDNDHKRAQKKVINFFNKVPKDFSEFESKDNGKFTVLMFIKSLVIYISKYRGGRFFYLDEILNKIKKEAEKIDTNNQVDKSDTLFKLLEIE